MEVKMNYKKLLEESWEEYKEECNTDFYNKYNFLADAIFDITTYENVLSAMMAKEYLSVCEAITKTKTFEMVFDNAELYLRTINYSFFMDRISWGSSIRGAWWESTIDIDSCDLWYKGEQLCDWKLSRDEWDKFVVAMLDFVEGDEQLN